MAVLISDLTDVPVAGTLILWRLIRDSCWCNWKRNHRRLSYIRTVTILLIYSPIILHDQSEYRFASRIWKNISTNIGVIFYTALASKKNVLASINNNLSLSFWLFIVIFQCQKCLSLNFVIYIISQDILH